jgi:hypothetical protein
MCPWHPGRRGRGQESMAAGASREKSRLFIPATPAELGQRVRGVGSEVGAANEMERALPCARMHAMQQAGRHLPTRPRGLPGPDGHCGATPPAALDLDTCRRAGGSGGRPLSRARVSRWSWPAACSNDHCYVGPASVRPAPPYLIRPRANCGADHQPKQKHRCCMLPPLCAARAREQATVNAETGTRQPTHPDPARRIVKTFFWLRPALPNDISIFLEPHYDFISTCHSNPRPTSASNFYMVQVIHVSNKSHHSRPYIYLSTLA